MTMYQHKVREILATADEYHEAYYRAVTFSGPSLYFHRRAIETRHPPASLPHLEYVYATLVSWGMHRMGTGGSKMQSFDTFHESVLSLKEEIFEAQTCQANAMRDQDWELLRTIFLGLDIMASGTSLVGNSKAMHHMIPEIVPPIDRRYTLNYLLGSTGIKNDLEGEWHIMRNIISEFFMPIACDPAFRSKADRWISNQDQYPWDTSVLKVIDNLVIGSSS